MKILYIPAWTSTVWFFKVPCIKGLVPRVAVMGGHGIFKGWD
jgi:hypothetical protein